MSAYIINEETMNLIVNHLCRHTSDEAAQRKGDALYQLNLDAVQWRYPDDEIGQLPGPVGWKPGQWRFRRTMPPNKIQTYKSIRCFLYQCSEGDVPGQSLYQEMEELARDLAEEIVSDLPQYDAAKWG